jgi:hypothetical protein
MNQREWFIIQNQHYVGPYSKAELIHLFKDKKINRRTSIINLSLNDKYSVEQFFSSPAFTQPSIQKKKLPSIVGISHQKKQQHGSEKIVQFKSSSHQHDTPKYKQNIEQLNFNKKSIDLKIETNHLIKNFFNLLVLGFTTFLKVINLFFYFVFHCLQYIKKIKPVFKKPEQKFREFKPQPPNKTLLNLKVKLPRFNFTSKKFLGLSVLIPICLILVYFSFQQNTIEINKPQGVRHDHFRNFSKSIQKMKKNTGWSFLQSKDFKKIWVGTNYPGTLKLELSFKSEPEKVLSIHPIQFKVETYLNEHISEVKDLRFLKGEKIIPGFYTVEIRVLENYMSFWEKIFSQSIRIDKKKTYKSHILLMANSKKQFLTDLKKFKKAESMSDYTFLTDIKQKYHTLIVISKNLSKKIAQLKDFKSPAQLNQSVEHFTELYRKDFGSFFTSFVVENDQKFKELTQSSTQIKTKIVAHYSWLSRIAKKLGIISADFFGDYKKILSDPNFVIKTLKDYNNIISLCDKRLTRLESQAKTTL